MNRICGIETEYGCLVPEGIPITPDGLAVRIKDWVFQQERLGIVDIHYRDRDEPPGNGGFLFNAGRVYIDMGHVEYATPECTNLFDLVAFDKAGEWILQQAIEGVEMVKGHRGALFKNNIDHFTGATFGCHENYLIKRNTPFATIIVPGLLPFFATRQIFAGAGRVGCYSDVFYYDQQEMQNDKQVPFQISQRSDYIVTEIYQWIQFSRAIINTRDEPLADHTKYRRLHLLVGDSNMSEYAIAMKIGTTALILDLAESSLLPRHTNLADPVQTLREVSRDQTFRWIVELQNGRTIPAIDLQRKYLAASKHYFAGRDRETDWILAEWETVLNDLERDPTSLIDRIDWAAKKWLLETFKESEGVDWDDPWLKSLDLEYHNLDPKRGLYHGLLAQGMVSRLIPEERLQEAMIYPPQNTRAKARSAVLTALAGRKIRYIVDWDSIYLEGEQHLVMDNPFDTYSTQVKELVSSLNRKAPFFFPKRGKKKK
jgi:proteasome accessory factor A